MKIISFTILFLVLNSTLIYSQRPDAGTPQGENFQVPEGWNVRLDHDDTDVVIGADPDSSDVYFVNMTPGWHITTGPAGIFYHPANTAEGDYTVESSIHLFNPGERHREAYGLFIGGSNLEDENQEYVYFLIRNTGDYLVKHRHGEGTSEISGWTPHDAIVKYEDPEVSSVKNDLTVEVSGDKVAFSINGEEVTEIDAADLETDGVFGLRINHSLNVHISNLKVSEE